MTVFRTVGKHGYSTKFSPFRDNHLVCVACENYGISGRGYLHYLDVLSADETIESRRCYQWPDALFEVTWCETDPDVCVTASGDGSLQIWNARNEGFEGPVQVLKEHSKEVYSVEWCLDRRHETFASGSWDNTVKIWCSASQHSIATLTSHQNIVYCVSWSPHIPDCLASTSGDATLRIWDLKCPAVECIHVPAHGTEILSCDWNKHDQNIIVSAATDGLVRGWDLRNPRQLIFELRGHQYAVRRVKFQPHSDSILATVSYDFTTRLWDCKGVPRELARFQNHTEFVYGLDFNLHIAGEMADCGFDELLCMTNTKTTTSTN